MRVFPALTALTLVSLLLASPGFAKQYALIIGNADYGHLEDLDNTLTDAAAYEGAFKGMGFETVLLKDLDRAATWGALDQLIAQIKPGDQVVFVYSGHGWSNDNINYLIPVDAPIQATDKQLVRRSIALTNGRDGILDELELSGATLRVAIFDACRNNPFKPLPGMKSAARSRGLVPISVPRGTFVVFSAGAGQTALDGLPGDPAGRNLSVFTRNFLPKLKAGMYLEDAISDAQLETAEMALSDQGHLQHPSYYDQTLGKTCLLQGRCGLRPVAPQSPVIPEPRLPAQPSGQPSEQPSEQASAQELIRQPPPQDLSGPPQAPLSEQMAASAAVRGCDQFGLSPAHPDVAAGRAFGAGMGWSALDGGRAEQFCRAALKSFPGHPRLLTSLGRGLDRQEDYSAAIVAYEAAARAGDVIALHNLGIIYDLGNGVPEDDVQAVDFYRQASLQGFAASQFRLGWMYDLGLGVPEDDQQAVQWFRKAAMQGDAAAQRNLGWMIRFGRGIAQDDALAVSWYRKAAAQGDIYGQHNLGWMYERGNGVDRDNEQAVKWYRLAAAQGYANSQHNLGLMYDRGAGVADDDEQALAWYRKAAAQDHAGAQFLLGHKYQHGQGVSRDLLAAARWYALAHSNGSRAAKTRLESLVRQSSTARDIQSALKQRGYYHARIDGSFGAASYAALKQFCGCSF